MTRRRIITVGDVVRYKPTGHVDTVKAIYAGIITGVFECIGGTFQQARAILVLENDSGHYPAGDDIELLLPEDVDEEGRYPVGGMGRSRPTEYACGKCDPSRFPDKACWVWCHRQREHFVHEPQGMEYVCKMCNPSVGSGEPTVMRRCIFGRTDTPHVLVPK